MEWSREILEDLADPPSRKEVGDAIQSQTAQLIVKMGYWLIFLSMAVLLWWIRSMISYFSHGKVRKFQFKDAVFVTIFKRKGDSHDSDNLCGISLLAIALKILTKLRPLVVPSSRSFPSLSVALEVNVEQLTWFSLQDNFKRSAWNKMLAFNAAFIDLSKVFDSVPCDGLSQVSSSRYS